MASNDEGHLKLQKKNTVSDLAKYFNGLNTNKAEENIRTQLRPKRLEGRAPKESDKQLVPTKSELLPKMAGHGETSEVILEKHENGMKVEKYSSSKELEKLTSADVVYETEPDYVVEIFEQSKCNVVVETTINTHKTVQNISVPDGVKELNLPEGSTQAVSNEGICLTAHVNEEFVKASSKEVHHKSYEDLLQESSENVQLKYSQTVQQESSENVQLKFSQTVEKLKDSLETIQHGNVMTEIPLIAQQKSNYEEKPQKCAEETVVALVEGPINECETLKVNVIAAQEDDKDIDIGVDSNFSDLMITEEKQPIKKRNKRPSSTFVEDKKETHVPAEVKSEVKEKKKKKSRKTKESKDNTLHKKSRKSKKAKE